MMLSGSEMPAWQVSREAAARAIRSNRVFIRSFLAARLISRIGIGLEKYFDVRDRVDEGVEALVGIKEQGAAGNDQHPVRVPDRPPNEPGIGGHLRGIHEV